MEQESRWIQVLRQGTPTSSLRYRRERMAQMGHGSSREQGEDGLFLMNCSFSYGAAAR